MMVLGIRTVAFALFSFAGFGEVAATETTTAFACNKLTSDTDYLSSKQIAPRIDDSNNNNAKILVVSICGDTKLPIYREFFTRIYHPDSLKPAPSLAALSTLRVNRHLDPSPDTHATGLLAKIANQPFGYVLKMRIRAKGQLETDISQNLNLNKSNEIEFIQAGFQVKIRVLE